MASIIYWTDERIRENQRLIKESINKGVEIIEDEREHMLDKMASSEKSIKQIKDENTVQVEGTKI